MHASNIALTAVCVVALVVATAMAVRWGRLRVAVSPLIVTDDQPAAGRLLSQMARSTAIAIGAGAIAGTLVLGLGGRLAMRIMAATSSASAQGRLTNAKERVGEITVGGTIGLVIFVGILGGIVGALSYLVLRRWLTGPAWASGLAMGVLGLVAARILALDPDSVDFTLLRPTALAVALFVALILGFGVVVASLTARFDQSYPQPAWRPRAVLAYAPLLLLLVVPPLGLFVALAVVVVLVAAHIAPLREMWRDVAVDKAVRLVLAGGGVATLGWLGVSTGQIIAGP
jgi:hypothetical protein